MNTNKANLASGPATKGRRLHLPVRLTMLALFVLLAAPPVLAVNGRDFAGFYQYAKTADFEAKTADLGAQTQVTLSLRVFNYSGADVAGATLTLERFPFGETYGSVAGITIPAGGDTSVSASFVVPAAEYQHWQEGAAPQLRIDFTDGADNRMRRPIELMPDLMGEQP